MIFSVMNKTDIGKMICIASTNDGPVTASEVIDVIQGNLNLALPENNEETDLNIKCIQYKVEPEREMLQGDEARRLATNPLLVTRDPFSQDIMTTSPIFGMMLVLVIGLLN